MSSTKSVKQVGYDQQAAASLLQEAKRLADSGASFTEANNRLFGLGSDFAKQFPTCESRAAFHAGREHKQIRKILAGLSLPHESGPDPHGPSGKFLVRVPQSLHAELQAEAASEGVSLNQLVLTKLAISLRRSLTG
ncbi:MAG: toxin-antitoxin system HicB family antitoxin [Candidatus Paceibacterota bacterium]